jgi:hypothetical protein
MKYSFVLFLALLQYAGYGNDGSFYASGNTLIPLKENVVQLKKEVLNLTRQVNNMQVDIYFEFFNPGEEKELLVGFVTPPASGDISEGVEDAHPQITGFSVMVNNNLLPYKITRMQKSGFKIGKDLAEGDDFVYHFTVKFKKGTTIVRHSYQYRGGASVEASHEFYYRLTTGATWANKEIEDFEMNINMGEDVVFMAPNSFNKKKADWNVIGIGKVNETGRSTVRTNVEMPNDCAVYIKNGTLQLKEKHFTPLVDLSLTMPHLYVEYISWCLPGVKNDFDDLKEFFDKDTARVRIAGFSDAQLRIYRNLHYARKGYDFKDPVLKQTFNKYVWYIPDPNLKLEGFNGYYFNKEIQQMLEDEDRKRNAKK